MYKNKKILAIIPARGGSKGIPNKNIIDVQGRPLISYSIASAQKSKYLDKIAVSSDNQEILGISLKYGAKTIKRPSELSQDNSGMAGVIKHALENLRDQEGFLADWAVLLQPTSPLRKAATINSAIECFGNVCDNYDSLIPLKSIGGKIGKIENQEYTSIQEIGRQRQEINSFYQECGVVYIFKPEFILNNMFYGKKIFPFIINDFAETIDVDTYNDLKLAEYYLKFNFS